MNIGILTWAKNINYGGALQAIALREAIAKIGHSPSLINYTPLQSDLRYRSIIFRYSHGRMPRIVSVLVDVFLAVLVNGYLIERFRRIRNSRKFVKNYSRLDVQVYNDNSSFSRQTQYDTIVVGSDQVWSPYAISHDKGYLLQGQRDNVHRISYAASISSTTLGECEQIYRNEIPRFSAVSVREDSARRLILPFCLNPVKWVVDPTLLLDSDDWCDLLSLNVKAGNYVTVYWLSSLVDSHHQLIRFAKFNHIKLHLFMNVDSLMVDKMNPCLWLRLIFARLRILFCPYIKVMLSASPCDFLRDLSGSQAVISDSYHALMFSVIFKKPINVVIPQSRRNMSSRLLDFLSKCKSSKNVCSVEDVGSMRVPASAEIVAAPQDWIDDSKHWLREALS